MLQEYIQQIESLNLGLEDENLALEKSLRLFHLKEVKEKMVYKQRHEEESEKRKTIDPSL